MRVSGRLLWIDCSAGAIAGVAILALSEWLSRLYGLPHSILLLIGAANLLYATFSFSLARRAERPLPLASLLAWMNMGWAPVCIGILVAFQDTVTGFGTAHLVAEAVFVGCLGAVEWRLRHRLLSRYGVAPGAGTVEIAATSPS